MVMTLLSIREDRLQAARSKENISFAEGKLISSLTDQFNTTSVSVLNHVSILLTRTQEEN
jgi:hypothetical protein